MIPEFRGLYKTDRSWVYGSYIHCEVYGDIIKPFDSLIEYDVIPETVGQYIGLKDTTQGHAKIFVHDIVEWDDASKGEYWRRAKVICGPEGYGFEILPSSPTGTPGDIFWMANFIYCPDTNRDGNVLRVIGSQIIYHCSSE